jgi:hypothetical protein
MAREYIWGKFKWSRLGYAEAMDGNAALQGMLRGKAEGIAARATSMLAPDGHDVPAFRVSRCQGTLAKGFRVSACSEHAKHAQAKHKILTRAALSSGG